jgi:CRP/FNR family transcriptional regulator
MSPSHGAVLESGTDRATARAPEPGQAWLSAPPAPCAVLERFRPGALVVLEGQPAGRVYLVRRGRVRVYLHRSAGAETTAAVLGPAQLVGVDGLAGRARYHASAAALTAVELWAMPTEELLAWLPGAPTLLLAVVDALGRQLVLAETLLGDVPLARVGQRVPDVLGPLAACLGHETSPVSRALLARLVGARRETVSRALGPRRPARPA